MTDPRRHPPEVGSERELLDSFLDFHRATLMWKCKDLREAELKQRSVPPTTMTLLGIVRHMTEVERSWFQRRLAGQDSPPIYYSDEKRDDDFDDLGSHEVEEVFRRWREECQTSRDLARDLPLDHHAVRMDQRRRPFTLRWIYLHMIEEYARHNGHADLIREAIDGAVGE